MLTSSNVNPKSLRTQFIMFHDCWHLVNYTPRSNDAISQSILRYKQMEFTISERWNQLAFKHITQLNIQPDCILRALASREMIASGSKPLDQLCHKLADHYHIRYDPFILMKKDFTPRLHNLPKKERIEALKDQYTFYTEEQTKKILILDDIVTTGTTMLAIREAIKKTISRSEIYFFVFAKTVAAARC